MYIRLLVVGVIGVLLSACSGYLHPITLKDDDQSVTIPELELVFPAGKRREGRSYGVISVSAAYSEAGFQQEIPAGKYAIIDGAQIDGPAVLEGKETLGVVDVEYIRRTPMRWWCSERYWGVGAGYMKMDFSGIVGAQQYDVGVVRLVPKAMYGLMCTIAPKFNLEASASVYNLFPYQEDILFEQKILLNYQPSSAMRLFVGYRHWLYEYYAAEESPIKVDYYGPTAGMTWYF